MTDANKSQCHLQMPGIVSPYKKAILLILLYWQINDLLLMLISQDYKENYEK